ncbi:HAD family hydrolase [Secundilactobacillus collinoides]|uniref:HAD superfamily hydrolase n=1 Tax=Secundilactobacillus collinoides DSM 20515 = JCM 1123 TaxID=1423733 RepID=A0A0R2BDP6_SECCO|nr:HAD family hydrolase [Secundilactobacillus collinoides]KRM76546.1 HAD superfamily hydrolase [Secundilactobacillus collinoides DSM 20515 = JCM 1123]
MDVAELREEEPTMIKAVVFDLDDTLYDQLKPFKRAVEATHKDLHLSEVMVQRLYRAFKVATDQAIQATDTATFARQVDPVLDELGLPAFTSDHSESFWEHYRQELTHIDLFADIRRCLSSLKEHYQLGVITNGETDLQSKKALQLDLHHWIDRDKMLISDEVGLQKPDARIFTYFNRMLDLQANEAVYIGDNYNTDMIGAKQAGWQAFWFNHRHAELRGANFIPDQTVETTEELADLLEAMSVATY